MPSGKPLVRIERTQEVEDALQVMDAQIAQFERMSEITKRHSKALINSIGAIDPSGKPVINEQILKQLAWDSIVTLHLRATWGDRQAATDLLKLTLGNLEQTFAQEIAHWSEQDVNAEITQMFRDDGRWSDDQIAAILDTLMKGPRPALPEGEE